MPFRALLENLGRTLDEHGIPYMIVGGQAVLIYGEPRLTRDIDITLGIGVEELQRVRDVASRLGLKILVEDADDFVRRTMVLPTLDEKTGIRVDFIFSFTPYERQAIERANRVKLGDVAVNFASVEDVIIHKVIAGRPRDIEDAKTILLKNPDYDSEYIVGWLEEFDRALKGGFLDVFKRLVESL